MRRANRNYLRPDLHQARQENIILANGLRLANEANAHALRKIQFGLMQDAGIAQMHVHISGSGLQENVRAERRRPGIFRVT